MARLPFAPFCHAVGAASTQLRRTRVAAYIARPLRDQASTVPADHGKHCTRSISEAPTVVASGHSTLAVAIGGVAIPAQKRARRDLGVCCRPGMGDGDGTRQLAGDPG
jgi:hypothetical protein